MILQSGNLSAHLLSQQIFSPRPELSASGADAGAAALTLRRMFAEAVALLDNELSLFQTLVLKRLHKRYPSVSLKLNKLGS